MTGRTTSNPYFPERTETVLEGLLDKYDKTTKPVEMDFRALVPWIKSSDRSSHIHPPLPGKIAAHIVHLFLARALETSAHQCHDLSRLFLILLVRYWEQAGFTSSSLKALA